MQQRGPKHKILIGGTDAALRQAIAENEIQLPRGHEVHLIPGTKCLANLFGCSLQTVKNSLRAAGWSRMEALLLTKPREGADD